MKNRKISNLILQKNQSKTGRIIVLTGARQTGKTTLVKKLFPGYAYISVEDPVMRGEYSRLSALQWQALYPHAMLDEVQKEPALIESIKSVYDQWPEPTYILLGSSQLLLLEKVKESLAGRSTIIEMFPLTLPELRTESWEEAVEDSLFQQELKNRGPLEYLPSFHFDKKMLKKQGAWEHYLSWGGYPALTDKELRFEEKQDWLRNYVRTYLERDVRDLASFRDLEPFVKLQQLLALNTGNLLNMTAFANQLGLTAKTVQRYIRYFEISYQVILLPAWSKNANKRLVKMPKIHFMDQGVVQAVLRKTGGVTGNEFESLVIAEIYKQVQTINAKAGLYHLRTHDGREVDLLIEMPDGYYAIEIKMADKVSRADAKHLTGIGAMLDKPLKKAFVLSNDKETKQLDEMVTALNVAMFLG
jgi:predicted AAA+ superfamily ATPase